MFAQSFELDGDLPWVFLEMFDESKQQDILWHRSQDWKGVYLYFHSRTISVVIYKN